MARCAGRQPHERARALGMQHGGARAHRSPCATCSGSEDGPPRAAARARRRRPDGLHALVAAEHVPTPPHLDSGAILRLATHAAFKAATSWLPGYPGRCAPILDVAESLRASVDAAACSLLDQLGSRLD